MMTLDATAEVRQEVQQELTEQEVVRLAQQGDAAAFEKLYKKNNRRVYCLCLRMLRNAPDAEDLTQEVFLRVFRKIGTFRGDSSFATWLHRMTVNAVLMHLRRKKHVEVFSVSAEHAGTEGQDQMDYGPGDISMFGAVERLNLMRAIHMLPSGYRRFFLLYHAIGYKHKEIAGLLSCSIGCSKSQVHKARKRLQQLLLGEHVEDGEAPRKVGSPRLLKAAQDGAAVPGPEVLTQVLAN